MKIESRPRMTKREVEGKQTYEYRTRQMMFQDILEHVQRCEASLIHKFTNARAEVSIPNKYGDMQCFKRRGVDI